MHIWFIFFIEIIHIHIFNRVNIYDLQDGNLQVEMCLTEYRLTETATCLTPRTDVAQLSHRRTCQTRNVGQQ